MFHCVGCTKNNSNSEWESWPKIISAFFCSISPDFLNWLLLITAARLLCFPFCEHRRSAIPKRAGFYAFGGTICLVGDSCIYTVSLNRGRLKGVMEGKFDNSRIRINTKLSIIVRVLFGIDLRLNFFSSDVCTLCLKPLDITSVFRCCFGSWFMLPHIRCRLGILELILQWCECQQKMMD